MPRAAPIIHRISPCPAQIPDRFVTRIGNVNRGEFTSPQQSRQLTRIALVSLDPLPRTLGSKRRRHHLAFHPQLPQASGQSKSARARFIARPQDHFFAMRLMQPSNPLFYRVQIIADRSALAHFSLAPFLRHRRDDTVFVDIQSDIEFFFHVSVFVCSTCLTATLRNTLFRPLVRLCSTSKKASSPRENMNGKHTPLFNPVLARSHPARSHKV